MSTLLLVDASMYIFRAWFSLPASLVDAEGRPVNAVYGFAEFLARLLEQRAPDYLAVAFDESLTTSFRNELYPPYKANRDAPPAELLLQFDYCRRLCDALGLASWADPRYEADDLIGTIAMRMRPKGFRSVYVTGDKDFTQLVTGRDRIWDFARDAWLGPREVRERFGVRPGQIVDWLALTGDAVDNIPGVPGIGPAGATALLQTFSTLDGVYKALHRIPGLPIRGSQRIQTLLDAHREQAYLSQALARIVTDAPIPVRQSALKRKRPRTKLLGALLDELDAGRRLRDRLGAIR